jgi:hypothetical protein
MGEFEKKTGGRNVDPRKEEKRSELFHMEYPDKGGT